MLLSVYRVDPMNLMWIVSECKIYVKSLKVYNTDCSWLSKLLNKCHCLAGCVHYLQVINSKNLADCFINDHSQSLTTIVQWTTWPPSIKPNFGTWTSESDYVFLSIHWWLCGLKRLSDIKSSVLLQRSCVQTLVRSNLGGCMVGSNLGGCSFLSVSLNLKVLNFWKFT